MNDVFDSLFNGSYGGNKWHTSLGIDTNKMWGDDMYEIRKLITDNIGYEMDTEVMRQIEEALKAPKEKTKEDRVVDIVKGDFEKHFGMSIQEFQDIYDQMVEDCPERLV